MKKTEFINEYRNCNSNEIVERIIDKNNIRYIKNAIKYREELGLGSSNIIKLILATKNLRYIKQCVKKRRYLRLASFHYKKLIIGTSDSKYIKETIKKRKKLNLCSYYVSELILATNDQKYIDECINNNSKFGFDSYVTTNLILSKKNVNYQKKCINNWKKLNLNNNDVTYLIKCIGDSEYTKKCINNYKKYSLNSSNIAYLIINTLNNKSKSKYIVDREKYNIDSSDLINILWTSNSDRFIKNNINNAIKKGLLKEDLYYINILSDINFDNDTTICDINNWHKYIPSNMTFGIEIETNGIYADKIKKIELNSRVWNIDYDDTVQENVSCEKCREIVSPVLKLHSKKEIMELKSILNMLNRIGQSVNSSCGGHIHIGFNYIDNAQTLINLIELWSNMEYIFFTITNINGTIPRGIEYASPISKKLERAIKKKEIKFSNKQNFDEIKKQIKFIQGIKGRSINFLNIDKENKNTIEFRCPNGTINYNMWIENIALFGNLIYVSKYISDILNNNSSISRKRKDEILNIYNRIINSKNQKEKLELFMGLTLFDDNIKSIYLNRFKTNDKLIRKNKKFYKILKRKLAKRAIILNYIDK